MDIKLTPLAEQDLEEISVYLLRHFPDKADATYASIEASCLSLIDFPAMGRESRITGAKELNLGKLPYRIIYRVDKDALIVLRIYHNSRKPLA